LKKDVEDLKTAAQLMRGVTGHLEGKAEMINSGFQKLVAAKSFMDSQIGGVMGTVNNASGVTNQLLTRITDVERQLDDLKKKAGAISGAMNAGKKLQGGDVMGGLNDLKNNTGGLQQW